MQGTRWQYAGGLWPVTGRLQLFLDGCYRLVLPYQAFQHAIDGTDPGDPRRLSEKSTTTSNHPMQYPNNLTVHNVNKNTSNCSSNFISCVIGVALNPKQVVDACKLSHNTEYC